MPLDFPKTVVLQLGLALLNEEEKTLEGLDVHEPPQVIEQAFGVVVVEEEGQEAGTAGSRVHLEFAI